MKLAILLTLIFQSASPDSVQAEAYFARYQRLQYRSYDSAIAALDQAIGLFKNTPHRKRQGQLLLEKGFFLKDNGKFDPSLATLKEALQIFESLQDQILQASTYNIMGITYWRSGDNANALTCYMKSLDINTRLNNKPGLLRNHIALGNYFAQGHQYEKAIERYEEARRYAGPADRAMYALVLKNSGNIYNDKHFGGYSAAKALEYYEKSLVAYRELGDTINIAGLHVNMGLVHENKNDLDNAERHYNYAIAMQNRAGLKADVVHSYLNIGNVLMKKEQIAEAEKAFLRGLQMAKTIKDRAAQRNIARKLSICLQQEKNFPQALDYFILYDSIDQVLYNEQTTATVKDLETKYETEKKQAEINLRVQQRDSMMITLIVGLAMTSVIVLIYSQRQKMVTQLRERDRKILNNKIDELLREQELKLLRAHLSGQDEERKRLAIDLHDRLGSTLSAVKLYFGSLTQVVPEERQSLGRASQLLDNAVEEVREISHNLLTGSIVKFGLKTALSELKETISGADGVQMNLFIHGLDERFDDEMELQLYRIIQELVSNVLKHARATEITLQLNKQVQEITLTVEDNGLGFDPGARHQREGIGLHNVESRVHSLGGTLVIDSHRGKGTTVLITIPASHDTDHIGR